MYAKRVIAHLQRGADALRPLTSSDYRDTSQVAYDAIALAIELLERCAEDEVSHAEALRMLAKTDNPTPEQVIVCSLRRVSALRKEVGVEGLALIANDAVVHLRKFGFEIRQAGEVRPFREVGRDV